MLVPFYSLSLSLPFTSISKLALHTFTPFFTFPFLLVGLLGAFPVWAETLILHHPLQHPDQLLLQLSLLYSVPPPSLSFTPSYTLAAHSSHSLHLTRFPSLSPPLTLTHSHTLSNLLLLSLTPSSISLERYNTPFGTDSRLHSLPSSALHCLKLSLTLALPTSLPTLAFFYLPPSNFPLFTPLSSILRGSSHCSNSHPRHLLHTSLASFHTAYDPLPVIPGWLLAGV